MTYLPPELGPVRCERCRWKGQVKDLRQFKEQGALHAGGWAFSGCPRCRTDKHLTTKPEPASDLEPEPPPPTTKPTPPTTKEVEVTEPATTQPRGTCADCNREGMALSAKGICRNCAPSKRARRPKADKPAVDPEFATLTELDRLLPQLDRPAVRRVLDWATAKFLGEDA